MPIIIFTCSNCHIELFRSITYENKTMNKNYCLVCSSKLEDEARRYRELSSLNLEVNNNINHMEHLKHWADTFGVNVLPNDSVDSLRDRIIERIKGKSEYIVLSE